MQHFKRCASYKISGTSDIYCHGICRVSVRFDNVLLSCNAVSPSVLKMGTVCSYETLVSTYQSTVSQARRKILPSSPHDNLISHSISSICIMFRYNIFNYFRMFFYISYVV
jgi:hypothetical protein